MQSVNEIRHPDTYLEKEEQRSMQYTHLGRTGLLVSRLCLGTMNFGPQTSEEDSRHIMDRALEHSLNFFDSANVYGGNRGPGATEEIIGRWFAQGGGRREKVVLATKVYGNMSDWPNDARLSARNIKLACEASLRRLQTDYIDLYQMHHIDRDTPWEEIWQAMEQLQREGKIIYVGSSNFAGWHLARASETAKARNFLGLVSEQSLYNLNARTVELEVLPAAEAYGLGVIPWSPLGGGLLGGALRKAETGRRADPRAQENVEKHRAKLEAYEGLCEKLGEEPANVALAWLLSNPIVTAPIIGPRTTEQLDGALRALEIEITPEIRDQLDKIFPGPGGAAPEAYAW
jgi:aryl-alcohol dehydrogenase-like predicted oxidoreductase